MDIITLIAPLWNDAGHRLVELNVFVISAWRHSLLFHMNAPVFVTRRDDGDQPADFFKAVLFIRRMEMGDAALLRVNAGAAERRRGNILICHTFNDLGTCDEHLTDVVDPAIMEIWGMYPEAIVL